MKRQGSVLQDTKFKKTKKPAYKRQSAGLGLEPELKYHDTSMTLDATTSGAIVAVASVNTGDTVSTRDANKISVKSFEIRMLFEKEDIAPNAAIRVMLIRNRNCNQTTLAAITSVLDSITVQSLRETDGMSRFDVLMDKTFVINQTADTAGCLQKYFFKKYVKVNEYDSITSYGGGSTIPVTNDYNIIYFSDIASGATDINVYGQCRMRFVG